MDILYKTYKINVKYVFPAKGKHLYLTLTFKDFSKDYFLDIDGCLENNLEKSLNDFLKFLEKLQIVKERVYNAFDSLTIWSLEAIA